MKARTRANTPEARSRSRAHRTLRKLDHYYSDNAISDDHARLVQAQFEPRELLVGVYQNSETDLTQNFMLTTRGVYVFREGWTRIDYEQITDVRVPLGDGVDKSNAETLVIDYAPDQQVELKVTGGHGSVRDIWGVFTFFIRIVPTMV